MRRSVTVQKISLLMQRLGEAATGPGRVYFTGGTTALLLGIREQTIDVDLKLDPEPAGIFEAIAKLKDELDINIELASPDQFIPQLPGWQKRSVHIRTVNSVEFYHFDYYSLALAKIERGHEQDILDVRALRSRNLINLSELRGFFQLIKPNLIRFPSIDAATFAEKVESFCELPEAK